jgi:hypothetical protein
VPLYIISTYIKALTEPLGNTQGVKSSLLSLSLRAYHEFALVAVHTFDPFYRVVPTLNGLDFPASLLHGLVGALLRLYAGSTKALKRGNEGSNY